MEMQAAEEEAEAASAGEQGSGADPRLKLH